MGVINAFLTLTLPLLLPALILLHLYIAPYTKVEESFNIQATHDIIVHGIPTTNISARLNETYDHFAFPGAVPRTFVGSLLLATISKPLINLTTWSHAQQVVRAVLGLLNAAAMLSFAGGLGRAYGKGVKRWYIVLQACQFHVMFYASRTLPNMFAFGLTTFAAREFLPLPGNQEKSLRRTRLGIYLLVLAGVVFRAEVAVLLAAQVGLLLLQKRITVRETVVTGVLSAVIALVISVPIDSYFWQRPIWPELAGFYFNAVQGKSAEWGTAPFYFYFTNSIPRMLINPLILLLIPLSLYLPSTSGAAKNLIIPPLAFTVLYSIMPHKESRFIIYAVPPLTAAAALSASYIYTRRAKGYLYRLASLIMISSLFFSLTISNIMLAVSSQNYPGGEALTNLHEMIEAEGLENSVSVHMDVLSCMTGVTRFLQQPPLDNVTSSSPDAIRWSYDKTEDEDTLHLPEFWEQFDYVLAEKPELVIGKWDRIGTVYGFSGIEFLRPGEGSEWQDDLVDAVQNAFGMDDENEDGYTSEYTSEPASHSSSDASSDSSSTSTGSDVAPVGAGAGKAEKQVRYDIRGSLTFDSNNGGEGWIEGLDQETMQKLGSMIGNVGWEEIYLFVRETLRGTVTRGWWIGPRMEAKIRVLRKSTGDIEVV